MTCFILVEVLMKMHFQYTSNKLKPLLCKVVMHRTVINMKRYHMSVISKKNIRSSLRSGAEVCCQNR